MSVLVRPLRLEDAPAVAALAEEFADYLRGLGDTGPHRLTAEAIARDGLQLAGWVANIIDPKTSRLEENLATLAERIPAPCLGRVPKLKSLSAEAVADHLQLDLLD